MVKKIIVLGVVLIMSLGIFSGCDDGVKEKSVNNMIELHTWYFTSGLPNNAIIVKHSNENTVFECTVDIGRLGASQGELAKRISVNVNETVHWDNFDENETNLIMQAFVEIILRDNDYIIGYAVIKINKASESSWDYNAKVLRSALFPKISGQYQEISEEYVKTAIEKVKTEKGEK